MVAAITSSQFCCVRCGAPGLTAQEAELHCDDCEASYPIVHGVPIFFADTQIEVHPATQAMASDACSYQGLPQDATTLATVQGICSKNYRFGDFRLDAEKHQFLNCVHIAQTTPEVLAQLIAAPAAPARWQHAVKAVAKRILPDPLQQKIKQWRFLRQAQAQTAVPAPASTDSPLSIAYAWVGHYLPTQVNPEATFLRNVRLENTGTVAISSTGPTPVMIAYHWRLNGTAIDSVPEHRTPLLIDLQPGQQLTVSMLLTTPKQPGDYELQLCLVQEGVCWHEANALNVPIQVISTPIADPTVDWEQDAQVYDYQTDHQQGIDLLKAYLPQDRPPRILEVGGNSCPMLLSGFSGQLYNLDIDIHGLQMGNVTSQLQGAGIEFVCADVNALPFPDGYFDCITMFASLHHFPDLRQTLRLLAQKIKPQGFLGIMCEPVGHFYGDNIDPKFREELERGINEQTFSLPEYGMIFQDAGLVPERVVVNAYSLKSILKRRSL
jgi:SAM-dependent methyltransferase/uncharacterized protein YbaR (Trm112 family)